jgi:hypothetical protein
MRPRPSTRTSSASSACARARSATRVTSGRASDAVRSSASRVASGRAATRRATSTRTSSGTGSDAPLSLPSTRRAISSAYNGLPPDASAIRTSVGRGKLLPRRTARMRWSEATDTGPSSTRCTRSRNVDVGSMPARTDAIRRTGSSVSRRNANSSPVRDAGSSHCMSSIPITTSPLAATCRKSVRSAVPTVRRSGGRPAARARRSATSSACCCGSGSAPNASGAIAETRSESAANDSFASTSVGRATSASAPPSCARRMTSSHMVVFPMPGSPTITSAAKPASAARNASAAASSVSRPTTLPTRRA